MNSQEKKKLSSNPLNKKPRKVSRSLLLKEQKKYKTKKEK